MFEIYNLNNTSFLSKSALNLTLTAAMAEFLIAILCEKPINLILVLAKLVDLFNENYSHIKGKNNFLDK